MLSACYQEGDGHPVTAGGRAIAAGREDDVDTSLSKTLSYWLRHAPEDAKLEMDRAGYVALEDLAEALRRHRWPGMDCERLRGLIDDPDAERFERRGDRVRAVYGHSVEIQADYPETEPDFPLYHGTSRSAWSTIRREGLRPMNRRFVHLSRTVEEARRVGRRHDAQPVVLRVQPTDDTVDHPFFDAGPVVLTPSVPPGWLEPADGE